MWRYVAPVLREAGFRTLAFDLPGFGESPAPIKRASYRVERVATEVLASLDRLGVSGPVDVVGHDWGAFLSWVLCLRHPDRVGRHVALSVGHPTAYVLAGLEQKRKGTYMLKWQLPRVTEARLSRNDFAGLRDFFDGRHPDEEQVIADLGRPGRLTAGLNWYRANYLPGVLTRWPRCTRPTLGVWSTADRYLAEDQMVNSRKYLTADWRYERLNGVGHWMTLEAPKPVAALILEWLRFDIRS